MTRKKKPTTPEEIRAVIEGIANTLEVTLPALASAIFDTALAIDDEGNQGISVERLQRDDLPVYFLTDAAKEAWNGIVFYNAEREVWQCRKNPNWKQVWRERYGDLNATLSEQIREWFEEQARIAAEAATEKAKVARPAETFALGNFADYDTDTIARFMVYTGLMSARYERKWRESRRKDNFLRLAALVWEREYHALERELNYRSKMQDGRAILLYRRGASEYFEMDQYQDLIHNDEPIIIPEKKEVRHDQ
jgi:hypothetical protein